MTPAPDHERLSAQDASFVMFEQRATHMHVAALAIFEAGPLRTRRRRGRCGAHRALRRVAPRRAAPLPPEARLRAALGAPGLGGRRPLRPRLPRAPHGARRAPGTEEELKRLVGRVLSQPLDRDRPLWEMWIVEGLEGDRFALLTKVHHCMVDGAAGVSVLTLLLRTDRSAEIPPTEALVPARPAVAAAARARRGRRPRASAPLALRRELRDALRAPDADAARRPRTRRLRRRGAPHGLPPAVGHRPQSPDRAAPARRVARLRPRRGEGDQPAARRHGERRRADHRGGRDAALPRAPRRGSSSTSTTGW